MEHKKMPKIQVKHNGSKMMDMSKKMMKGKMMMSEKEMSFMRKKMK